MGMTVRELVTKWGFNVDTKPLDAADKKISGLKMSIGAFAGFAIAKAGALLALAEGTMHTAHEIELMSQKTGIATDQLQKLQYAAKRSGVESEAFGMSLRLLAKHAYDASMGSEQAQKTFSMLGTTAIDPTSGKLKKMDQLLFEVSEQFKAMPDGMKKAALAQELFGRGSTSMIPMLNKGGAALKAYGDQADRLGIILNSEALENSKKFHDAQLDLMAVFEGLKNTIGAKVMPAMVKLAEKLNEWAQGHAKEYAQQLGTAFLKIADSAGSALNVLMGIMNIGAKLVNVLGGLGNVIGIIGAGFAMWATASTVIKILEVVEAVKKLAAMFKTAALMEALLTGGTNLWLGLAAAGVVGAGLALSDMRTPYQTYNPSSNKKGGDTVTNIGKIELAAHSNVSVKGPGAKEISDATMKANREMLRDVAAHIMPTVAH